MRISGSYIGAAYNLSITEGEKEKSLRELSTGKRINVAADDAAGLAIAKKLEAQSNEYSTKLRNYQTKTSFYQSQDTVMGGIGDSLGRLRELSLQAQNSTLSDDDVGALQDEANQILEGINDSANGSEFNTIKLATDFNTTNLGVNGLQIGDGGALAKIEESLKKISQKRGEIGGQVNGLEYETKRLGVAYENSVAATARIADTDMAMAAMNNAKLSILGDVQTAVSSQSNFSQQRILDILKD